MTKDDIIRFAIKCKLVNTNNRDGIYMDALIDFAKLVEDKVRQEIAEKNAPVIKKVNEHIKELQDAVKAERKAITDEYWSCVQSDLENGVKSLNQKATEDFYRSMPELSKFGRWLEARGNT
jgi:hypothetical protein